MTITELWHRQYVVLRLIADQQERIEVALCRESEARVRLGAIAPTLARQIWSPTP